MVIYYFIQTQSCNYFSKTLSKKKKTKTKQNKLICFELNENKLQNQLKILCTKMTR